MNLRQEELLSIMAYADSELEGAEAASVEELLRSSEQARRLYESFKQSPVGDLLREAADADGVAHGADGIAAAVMSQLPREQASNVVPLRGTGSTKAVLAVSCTLLAAAAGVLMYLESGDTKGGRPLAAPRQAASADGGAGPLRVAHGVTVEEVQSPDHDFAVFEIPASGAAASIHSSSVVIWVEDEEKKHHDAN